MTSPSLHRRQPVLPPLRLRWRWRKTTTCKILADHVLILSVTKRVASPVLVRHLQGIQKMSRFLHFQRKEQRSLYPIDSRNLNERLQPKWKTTTHCRHPTTITQSLQKRESCRYHLHNSYHHRRCRFPGRMWSVTTVKCLQHHRNSISRRKHLHRQV